MPPTGITTDSPEPLNQENAPVLMSQPLRSSCARRPSSRYTACGPPPWNCTRISRPMAADGTSSTSTVSARASGTSSVGTSAGRRPAGYTEEDGGSDRERTQRTCGGRGGRRGDRTRDHDPGRRGQDGVGG